MASINYGTLSTNAKNVKIKLTSQTPNGTSAVNTSGVVTLEFDITWNDYASIVPAQFSILPDDLGIANSSNYWLLDSAVTMTPAGMAHVVLTYQASYLGTPATEYTENNGSMDAPITEHPDFDTWDGNGWVTYDDNGQFAGFTKDSGLLGVESFKSPTSIVIKKTYSTSEPTDERGNIGKTQNPGRDYEGDTNWLVIGSSRALEAFFWTQTTTYQWSSAEWNSTIYDAV